MKSSLIGRKLGKYEITELLGHGGMATVYKGYQPEIDRYVAVKVLPPHPGQDEEFIDRFQLEARTIARLQHPHILPVYDYGNQDDILYLVMAYIRGGSLSDRIDRGGMGLTEVEALLRQIASALDYAHRQGIIHRDIKPDNILLNDEGFTLLTDFGIAKLIEGNSRLTATGSLVGTPAYMAPEQGQGMDITSAADLYSLGVVVYEMLTGQQPYHADTPIQVVLKHISDPLPSITKARPDIPFGLERVMQRALAKNPADRYPSATAFADAFRDAINDTGTRFQSPARDLVEESTTRVMETHVSNPTQPQTITIQQAPNNSLLLVGLGLIGLLVVVVALLVLVTLNTDSTGPVASATATQSSPPTAEVAAVPTSLPTFGRLNFVTTSVVGDTVNLRVDNLARPGTGSSYHVWLQTVAGDEYLDLGRLQIDALGAGQLQYTDADGRVLPALYNRLLISVEQSAGDAPAGDIRYSGSLPAEAGAAINAILVASEDGINGRSLLAGALSEAEIAALHAGLAANATTVGGLKNHAEHTLNILLGTETDYDGNGRGENPGRKIGVIFFLDKIEAVLDAAVTAPDASLRLQADGELIRVCLDNARLWVDTVVTLESSLFTFDNLPDSAPTAAESTRVMNTLINGQDLNQNGVIEPFEGECGMGQIEEYGVLFGGMDIIEGLANAD